MFVGGGASLLAEVMPFYEEMVHRWFSARFVTMLTVPGLRLRLRVAFPCTFNATPQLIQARLCRICSFRDHGSWDVIQHTFDDHPVECENLGHSLGHNRMPWPSVTIVGDPISYRIHPGW